MHQKSLIAVALAAAVAGSAGHLLAGPLDPPEGPIQPTYRTTHEIFNRIDQLTRPAKLVVGVIPRAPTRRPIAD